MGRIDFFLGVFFLSLVLPAGAPGFSYSVILDSSTRALAGTVFAEGNNERVPYARVVLCDDGGSPLQETYAADSGQFSFEGLRPAHYILRVEANAFQPVELHTDLSFSSERGLTVSLKPVRPSSVAQPAGQTISAHELSMPQAARDLLASGEKKLYTEKNASEALRDFQSATQRAPAFYEAYYQSGMAQLALRNSGEAEKQFRKSVELSQKKYADVDIALGTLLIHHDDFAEGEPLLRQGLASNPQSWAGQLELGELELSRGHMQPALAAAQTAAELAPHQAIVYRLLAVIHLREKNYPALITALDSYIELDPNSPAGLRAKELRSQAQQQLAHSPSGQAVAVK